MQPELQVLRPTSSAASTRQTDPIHRGRLLTATQLAAELFAGTVSTAWVRRHVPHKIVLGHSTVRWYESDVQAWIETRRTCALSGTATDC